MQSLEKLITGSFCSPNKTGNLLNLESVRFTNLVAFDSFHIANHEFPHQEYLSSLESLPFGNPMRIFHRSRHDQAVRHSIFRCFHRVRIEIKSKPNKRPQDYPFLWTM